MNVATGRYLAFIDSDDFIKSDMMEVLYNNIKENNADIACCEVYLFKSEKDKRIREKLSDIKVILEENNREEFYKDFYFKRLYSQNVRDKLYRAELIKAKILDLKIIIVYLRKITFFRFNYCNVQR